MSIPRRLLVYGHIMTLLLAEKKKKPSRPCLYCGEFFVDLRSHLLHRHRNEESVQKLATLHGKERLAALSLLRNAGILEKNKELIAAGGGDVDLIAARASDLPKTFCTECFKTISKSHFHHHRRRCMGAFASEFDRSGGDEFDKDIMANMEKDDIYNIICSDPEIMSVGKHIWASRKPSKHKEAKTKARTAMRRLARLVDESGLDSFKDLLKTENFSTLEGAIASVCKAADAVKSGMKVALGTLIRLAVKVLTADAIVDNSSFEVELERFTRVFNIRYAKIFGQAEYSLKEKRQRLNRKPTSLPPEKELDKLRKHLTEELNRGSEGFSPNEFVYFRRITLARITLLNARRGSEAARMLIDDFNERDEWIDHQKLTPEDKAILEHYKVTFIMGKGNSLVPIIIPRNCEAIMSKLVDPKFRAAAGVNPKNPFIFAYKSDSTDPVTGYNDLKAVCDGLGIETIDATSNRHRASTLFWEMPIDDDRSIDRFMSHLGHSRKIDEDFYAVPPVLATLRTVTPIVEGMDKVRIMVYIFFSYFILLCSQNMLLEEEDGLIQQEVLEVSADNIDQVKKNSDSAASSLFGH